MADQLWASPITGHRRVGTRQSEIRALFESGITVRAIVESLKSCPTFATASEIEPLLAARDFDLAGVKETEYGDVIGYIERLSLLEGKVRDRLVAFDVDILIADSTPLADLFTILRSRDHVFVLVATKVSGIVTRADLNKPAVRVYLFGLISLLEMHMNFWIHSHYGEDNWQQHLSPTRLEMAQTLYEERAQRNQEIDLFSCTQFADKRDLLLRQEELRQVLNIGNRSRGETFFKRSEDLRNTLAHSQQDLTEGSNWESIIDTVEWLERLLKLSDAIIEKEAAINADRFSENLW